MRNGPIAAWSRAFSAKSPSYSSRSYSRMKLNKIQKFLMSLYPCVAWVAVLLFTPHRMSARSGGVSINLMKFYPIWKQDDLSAFSRIDFSFIWVELALITITFVALMFVFSGEVKSRKASVRFLRVVWFLSVLWIGYAIYFWFFAGSLGWEITRWIGFAIMASPSIIGLVTTYTFSGSFMWPDYD